MYKINFISNVSKYKLNDEGHWKYFLSWVNNKSREVMKI